MENEEFIINFTEPSAFSVKLSNITYIESSSSIQFDYDLLEGEAPSNLPKLLEETILMALEQQMNNGDLAESGLLQQS